jgi:hypothetical protein
VCRFWRVRFGRLKHCTNLVTVDMHAHFAALAAKTQADSSPIVKGHVYTGYAPEPVAPFDGDELEQHRGIYVRMAMVKNRKEHRYNRIVLGKGHPRPMDLQVRFKLLLGRLGSRGVHVVAKTCSECLRSYTHTLHVTVC